MVQGGGFWLVLGFPSSGRAHQQTRETSGEDIIGSRTEWLANTSGVLSV